MGIDSITTNLSFLFPISSLSPCRFALKDLKAQCEAVAIRNISTANVAAIWGDVRKCASTELQAYTAHLIARNWNVLASSKMALEMAAADIFDFSLSFALSSSLCSLTLFTLFTLFTLLLAYSQLFYHFMEGHLDFKYMP